MARELRATDARVLVLDRYEIGERQTSACAAPTEWLTNLGLEAAILQTFDALVFHTPTIIGPLAAAVDVLDLRLPAAVRAAVGPARAVDRVRDRQGLRAHRRRRPHRPRRRLGGADRRRAGLAAAARPRPRGHPARGADVARARGPSGRDGRRSRGLDPQGLHRGGLRLVVPRRRRGPGGRRLLRAAPPRQGADRPPRRRPRPPARRLPGQLDPARDPPGRRRRRLLRRRLGRPLHPADRRGDPHGALLRDRRGARAAGRARGRADPRAGARALRALLGRARLEVRVDEALAGHGVAPAPPRPRRARALDDQPPRRRVGVRALLAHRPAGVRAARAARWRCRARTPRSSRPRRGSRAAAR